MAQIYLIKPLTISVLVCLDSQRIYWKMQGDKMTLFESFMEMAYKCLAFQNYNLYNYWREKAFSLSVEEAGMFYD